MLVTAIHPDEGRLTRPKYRWETKNIFFYSSLVVLYLLSCEVILACARVLLWPLAIPLEQMLPAGEVYFRPVMSSIVTQKAQGGVDFFLWSTVFWILFFEFHKVCWIRFSTWESFIGFHQKHILFPSLGQSYFYEPSVFTFRYVGDRISWKTWCWNENHGCWDVISCLLLSSVLYCMEGEFELIITKQGQ